MNIKNTLLELGVRPSKRRGQNFLISPTDAARIADHAGVSRGMPVVEIGPGLGALTRELFKKTDKLLVVEIEPRFVDYLRSEFAGYPPERIICGDILHTKASELAQMLGEEKFVVVSNVPYAVSTDVVLWVLENRDCISSASLLLQKEFAERFAAKPGTRECGALSVFREMYADASIEAVIPGQAFHPPADVDSVVVQVRLLAQPRITMRDEELFFKVVRALFAHRRKTVLNNLLAAELVKSREEGEERLASAGISSSRRAETLDLEEFELICAALDD